MIFDKIENTQLCIAEKVVQILCQSFNVYAKHDVYTFSLHVTHTISCVI